MENNTDQEMILIGEEPLKPGYYRVYEFLHGYCDYLISDREKWLNDPKNADIILLNNILAEEIQKEINREIIRKINGQSSS